MAFGQQAGPPATHRQVQQLTELIVAAGHRDFRDARGPLQLTQRQAGGRFTRDEADALIARLEADAEAGAEGAGAADAPPSAPPPPRHPPSLPVARGADRLRSVPSEHLAAELQRRGWVVMEPPSST